MQTKIRQMAHGILFQHCGCGMSGCPCCLQNQVSRSSLSGKDSRSYFIRSVASGLAKAQLFRRQEIPTLSLYLKETISISIASLDQNKSTRQTRKDLPQPSTPQSKSKAGSKSSTPQEKKMPKSQSATPLATPQKIKKQQQRCRNCPWKKNRKVTTTCIKCGQFVCSDHRHFVCSDCIDASNVTGN
ncbi:hypothetical protein PoB_006733600 [Plakobranchus ocellatus]|uniref:AN1-type domain-containing protein n=1 Tax=Plakobranchus ocellatus TaxID=259542 RepID=A0AAV4DA75_9GAST|nr:hypothetical protein PoB_006733600 [Plakobranchus ocellatus]